MKENDVVYSVCQHLALKGVFFWRSNTTPIFDAKRGMYRKMPAFALKGVPDILAVQSPTGRLVGLECKQVGKYLSPDQKIFRDRLESVGGIFRLVRSIEDVADLF